jgi:hypothetical protein
VPTAADPHAKTSFNPAAEVHEKPVKERRPESVVTAPANVPPGGPALKPFNPNPVEKGVTQFPPPGKGAASVEGPGQEKGRVRGEEDRHAKDQQIANEQEEARRHALEQQPQKTVDPRRGQEPPKDREHEKFEPQRANQLPPTTQRGNQPAVSPQPGGKNSKNSKDKDKDKDKGNGN